MMVIIIIIIIIITIIQATWIFQIKSNKYNKFIQTDWRAQTLHVYQGKNCMFEVTRTLMDESFVFIFSSVIFYRKAIDVEEFSVNLFPTRRGIQRD